MSTSPKEGLVTTFSEQLRTQRWDDHRYYHHCRINQSLHLLSAVSFLIAYVMLFIDPVWSALIGWLVSMTSRQAGHFFFEPLGYDEVNQCTNEYKEQVKVGYNLRRKVVLLSIWALLPMVIYMHPGLFGLLPIHHGWYEFLRAVGTSWLYLGIGGLLFRTLHLFILKSPMEGITWMSKILTDPLHDIYLYHKAPLQLLRGERFAPREQNASESIES